MDAMSAADHLNPEQFDPDHPDAACNHPYCKGGGYEEGWHTNAEHIDPPHLDPYSDASMDVKRQMEGLGGKDAEWLLDQHTQGPSHLS